MDKQAIASRSFNSLYNLSVDDAWLKEVERNLVRRARFDLENVANSLKHSSDTQTATVQAHEAVEKFLKAALSRTGEANLKKIGPDIPKFYVSLIRKEPRYSAVSLPALNLQLLSPNMELRYSHVPRSVAMAAEAYYGVLYTCGLIAKMWVFDLDRGTSKSSFKECSFYVDGSKTIHYCKGIRRDKITLTLFSSTSLLGSLMADLVVTPNESGLYLEVTNVIEDARVTEAVYRSSA